MHSLCAFNGTDARRRKFGRHLAITYVNFFTAIYCTPQPFSSISGCGIHQYVYSCYYAYFGSRTFIQISFVYTFLYIVLFKRFFFTLFLWFCVSVFMTPAQNVAAIYTRKGCKKNVVMSMPTKYLLYQLCSFLSLGSFVQQTVSVCIKSAFCCTSDSSNGRWLLYIKI